MTQDRPAIPAPRANPDLFGHAAAEATLIEAQHHGRLHHAWLLAGQEGIGKATLAYRFARRLLAGGAPGDTLALDPAHPVFRRVAAGSHADLLTIERVFDDKRKKLKTSIAIDDVRRVNAFLSLTPAEGGWRVVVVDGAEDLQGPAANALLKVLEEPPPRAVLLLVCAAPGRLPPTLRSRCRRLALDPLDDAAMDPLLARFLPDLPADQRLRLAALAEGSPGRALLLADAEGLRLAALVDEALAALPGLSGLRAYAIADALGRADGAFATFMDLLRAAVAAAVRDVLRGGADPVQARLVALRPVGEWSGVWQRLTDLQYETERFALDPRVAVVTGLGLLAQDR